MSQVEFSLHMANARIINSDWFTEYSESLQL